MGETLIDIHDGVLDLLKGSDLSGVCPTIDTYQGELDDLISEAESLTAPLPATYLLYTGSNFVETANRSFDEDPLNITVVFIARDLRGGDRIKESMYQILEYGKTALINQIPQDSDGNNLNTSPLKPVVISATFISKSLSVFSFDLQLTQDYN